MFPNLNAEMAREGFSANDIAKTLDVTEKSARNKLSGRSPFTLPEAKTVIKVMFPGLTIDYLFGERPQGGNRPF